MQLTFESISELEEFLEFSRRMGELIQDNADVREQLLAPAFRMTPEELSAEVLRQEHDQGNESAPAGELAAGATTGSTENAADIAASEAPKRKRRTKAEMEAARAADATVTEVSQGAPLTSTAQPAHAANPFEASTSNPSTATQAILSAPSGQAATLAGIQAMQNSPFDAQAVDASNPAAAAADSVEPSLTQLASTSLGSVTDAATYVETRSLEILSTQTEPLTAVKHMHLCRDFIAKHGQARYLEGFALAGLPATIGTYKPEQCAKHQAALEFLNLNA